MAANLPFLRAVMGSTGVGAQSMSSPSASTSSCSSCMRLLGPGVLHAVLWARTPCDSLSVHLVCALLLCASVSASAPDMALSSASASLFGASQGAASGEGASPFCGCFLQTEAGLRGAWLPDEARVALRVVALRMQSASCSATDISWASCRAALSYSCPIWLLPCSKSQSPPPGRCCARRSVRGAFGALRRQD